MKTIISSSIVTLRNSDIAPASLPTSGFGSGFRHFLETSEVAETESESFGVEQPTSYLESVATLDAGDQAWQSFSGSVRHSLDAALLLAMQPTRQAPGLASAVAALRRGA